MPHLSLAFLGPPSVTCDGQPVTAFESLKVRALLAYLATEADRPHAREALAGLFWPAVPDRAARHNLRHALANLRLAIHDREASPPHLLISRETIQSNPAGDHDLDVAGLQHLPCIATIEQLERAVALCRGAFLEGLALGDSPAFEEWLLLKREQYGRLAVSALRRLAAEHEGRGDYERAATCARRQIELEPWDEQAHQQLMRSLALGGQRSEALAHYERCRNALARELGVEPSAETVALCESIRAGTLRLHPARPSAPAFLYEHEELRARPAPVVVAREGQLDALEQFLTGARAGEGRVIFITGDPGSGKTVLLQELIRRAMAAQRDLLVAEGNATAYTGAGDPYLPFIEALQMLTGDVEGRWAAAGLSHAHALRLWQALPAALEALVQEGPELIGRFVPAQAILARARAYAAWAGQSRGALLHDIAPELARLEEWARGQAGPPPAQTPSQADLFEQYVRVLQALARRSPLLLTLDDLQWADAASVSLLFHLGRKLAGSRILVVGAYRPGDVAQGREGGPHPLQPVINEFQRTWGDIHIDLSQAEGRRFVDGLIESEPNLLDASFRDMLYRHTGGHPLFTVELLQGLREQGDLVQDRVGRWVAGGSLSWSRLPARVEAVIAELMRRLPAEWRALLSAASVEGEEFTAEAVAGVRGLDEKDALQWLSGGLSLRHRLVVATSCRRVGDRLLSRYRFRHYLFQKYLYSHLDEVERVHLHEAVGRALEGLYGEQPEELANAAPQLARHFQEAGDLERAAGYLQQAGERAMWLSANAEAIEHLRRGLALLEGLPQTPERARRELGLVLTLTTPVMAIKGYAALETGRVFARALELAADRQLGDPMQVIQALGVLGIHHAVRGEYPRSVELFKRAVGVAERLQDPLALLASRVGMGYALAPSGQFVAARPYLEYGVRTYDPQQHRALTFVTGQDVGVLARGWLSWCLWFLGYPDQALVQARRALAQGRASEHAFSLCYALYVAGCLLHLFAREFEAAREQVEATATLTAEAGFALFGAGAAVLAGWLQCRDGQLEAGIARMGEGLVAWQGTGASSMMPFYLALLGEAHWRAGRAGQAFECLERGLAAVAQSGERFWEAELYRLRGEWLAASGAGDAEACFRQALEATRARQARMLELRAAVSLGRHWQWQGRAEEARSLVAGVYGWFTEGFDTPDLRGAKALLEELPAGR